MELSNIRTTNVDGLGANNTAGTQVTDVVRNVEDVSGAFFPCFALTRVIESILAEVTSNQILGQQRAGKPSAR